jgi:hypothetical protein
VGSSGHETPWPDAELDALEFTDERFPLHCVPIKSFADRRRKLLQQLFWLVAKFPGGWSPSVRDLLLPPEDETVSSNCQVEVRMQSLEVRISPMIMICSSRPRRRTGRTERATCGQRNGSGILTALLPEATTR